MKLYRGLLLALSSLGANKLRSALTVLGIVIGVAAVIALVSIGRGAEASITTQIQSVGTNLLFVRPGAAQHGAVGGVSPEVNGRAQVVFLSSNTNTRVVGVTPEYPWVRGAELADGEFISQANLTARSTVVVLGSAVAGAPFVGKKE